MGHCVLLLLVARQNRSRRADGQRRESGVKYRNDKSREFPSRRERGNGEECRMVVGERESSHYEALWKTSSVVV